MDEDIEELAKSCLMYKQTSTHPAKAPLHLWEWPAQPWSRLHIDFVGPLLGHMYLVLVDAHLKWLQMQLIHSITIIKLQDIFAVHGLSQKIVTDNGSAITSANCKTSIDKMVLSTFAQHHIIPPLMVW